jgi:hypothetical protein
MTSSQHLYEVHPHKDRRGVDLISDALPFDRLWYGIKDDDGKAQRGWHGNFATKMPSLHR